MFRSVLVAILALAAPGLASAQAFITPVSQLPRLDGSYVIYEDGRRVEGKIKLAIMSGAYVKSLNLATADGKVKVKAEEVKQLGAKLGKLAKFMLVTDSLGNPSTPWGEARAFANVPWEEIINREYAIFDQAIIPGSEKTRLIQLLNPGFDGRLGVYVHFRKMTSMTNAGKITTYLVVKDGKTAFVVKKNDYPEHFADIFGDCEAFDDFPGKPKFKDFAAHVFVYDQACGPGEG